MGIKERLVDISARVAFGPKIEGDVIQIAGQDIDSVSKFHLGELEPEVRFRVRTNEGNLYTFGMFKDQELLDQIVPNFNTSSKKTEPARVKINQRSNWMLIRRVKGQK